MAGRVRRRWWALAVVAIVIYTVLVTFLVYGGFYLGSPPVTPAFLNGTRASIVRTLDLDRRSRLRVWGDVSTGRVAVRIDGRVVAQATGRFDRSVVLEPGRHELRIENDETTGRVNYRVE